MTLSELSAALAQRGFISEREPLAAEPDEVNVSPWYVQALMGACAWFAGVLLFAFVALELESVLFRGPGRWRMVLIFSVGTCAIAAVLFAYANNPFVNQFALAMSCAGQFGIAVGLAEVSKARTALWGMVIVEIVLTAVMRNRLHRFLSSMGAIIAYALAMHELLFGTLPGESWAAHTLGAPRGTALLVSILLWLVVWAPIAGAAWWLTLREALWMSRGRDALLRPVTYGLIAALSIAPLATYPDVFWVALGFVSGLAQVDGVALWPLMSLLLSLLALGLGFELRSRPLMGLAILFGLLEISSFYLVLGTTLLVKSLLMVSLGAILIAGSRWRAVTEPRTTVSGS